MLYLYGFSEEVLKSNGTLRVVSHKVLKTEEVPFFLKREIIDLSLGFVVNLEVVGDIEIPSDIEPYITVIPPEYFDHYIDTGEVPSGGLMEGVRIAGFPMMESTSGVTSEVDVERDRDGLNRLREDVRVLEEVEAVVPEVVEEVVEVLEFDGSQGVKEVKKEEVKKEEAYTSVSVVFDTPPVIADDEEDLEVETGLGEEENKPKVFVEEVGVVETVKAIPTVVEEIGEAIKSVNVVEDIAVAGKGFDSILTMVDDLDRQLEKSMEDSVDFGDIEMDILGGKTKNALLIEQLQNQIEDMEIRFRDETDTLIESYNSKIKFLESRLRIITSKLGNFIVFADNPIRRNLPVTSLEDLKLKSELMVLSPCYDVFPVLKNVRSLMKNSEKGVVVLDLSNTLYLNSVLKANPAAAYNLKDDDVVIDNFRIKVGTSDVFTAGVFNDLSLLTLDYETILTKLDGVAKGRKIIVILGCYSSFNNRYTSALFNTIPDVKNYIVIKAEPLGLTSLLYGFIKFVGNSDIIVLDYVDSVRQHLEKFGVKWLGFGTEAIDWSKLN